MPDPNPATYVLCEPAQLKRTWTFHKSHFVWKFTRAGYRLDQTPGLNTCRRNPFSVATLFGEILTWQFKKKNGRRPSCGEPKCTKQFPKAMAQGRNSYSSEVNFKDLEGEQIFGIEPSTSCFRWAIFYIFCESEIGLYHDNP